jgi:hypothetical protein
MWRDLAQAPSATFRDKSLGDRKRKPKKAKREVCFDPDNGHAAISAACPKSADFVAKVC